jgi:hypothetical protein
MPVLATRTLHIEEREESAKNLEVFCRFEVAMFGGCFILNHRPDVKSLFQCCASSN